MPRPSSSSAVRCDGWSTAATRRPGSWSPISRRPTSRTQTQRTSFVMPDAEPIAVPSPAELNAMSPDAFAAALGPLFEGGDRYLRRLAGARPFATDAELLAAAHEAAAGMPEEE